MARDEVVSGVILFHSRDSPEYAVRLGTESSSESRRAYRRLLILASLIRHMRSQECPICQKESQRQQKRMAEQGSPKQSGICPSCDAA